MATSSTSGRSAGAAAADRVREVVAPVVGAAGLYLEDVHVSPAGRRTVVRVVLDLGEDEIGSLDLDTLGQVSREISAALDEHDPVRGEYVLEISTPGTDRPLTEPRHFRRARTRLVRLTLRDGSVRSGRLLAVDAEILTIEPTGAPKGSAKGVSGEPVLVPVQDVVRGAVEVELTRASADDEQTIDDTDEHQEIEH